MINISPAVEVCLLGLVDQLGPKKVIRTLLSLLFNYACKIIVLSWKKPVAPNILACIVLVNTTLPLYKVTYVSRVVPTKFEKLWGGWINDKSTALD